MTYFHWSADSRGRRRTYLRWSTGSRGRRRQYTTHTSGASTVERTVSATHFRPHIPHGTSRMSAKGALRWWYGTWKYEHGRTVLNGGGDSGCSGGI